MNQMSPKKLIPLRMSLRLHPTREQLELCRQVINFHYLGDTNCNKYDGGVIVSKYPEKTVEHCKIYGAHTEIPRTTASTMTVWLMDNGTFCLEPTESIEPIKFNTVKTTEDYHFIPAGSVIYHCTSSEMRDRWFGYWADAERKVYPVEVPQNICEIIGEE